MGRSSSATLCAVVVAVGCTVVAGKPIEPHPHTGILKQYDRRHPSKYGVTLKGITEAQLRSGTPALKLIPQANGFKRTIGIQDIEAPPDVVFGRICDWPNYHRMIKDVKRCEVYRRGWKMNGCRVACAKYEIAVPMTKLDFYVEHVYDPLNHAMSFSLDYTRKSDVADQVGYWYCEKLAGGWTRLYYSTDFQIPRWVPPFAKGFILKLAAKSSVTWVAVETAREMEKRRGASLFRRWFPQ